MSEIIRNCNKMEAYLNGDYESLWRMEHQDATDLRNRLETVPVEIVHDDFDDMPPLEPDVLSDVSESARPPVPFNTVHPLDSDALSDVSDSMPPLVPFSTVYPLQSDVVSDVPDSMPPLEKPPSPLKNELNTAFAWPWPQTYTPMSAMYFNQQVRAI